MNATRTATGILVGLLPCLTFAAAERFAPGAIAIEAEDNL